MNINDIPKELVNRIREGTVIPALPLALNAERKFDVKYQKALVKYYATAGAGGLAVGVHSTQFEIRDSGIDLFEPILSLASETLDELENKSGKKLIKICGVCGNTPQAIKEASFAVSKGYHACLLSLTALKEQSIDEMIEHCKEISKIMPLIGFYLQPSVGGKRLSYEFWRKFVEIENVLAIKMAPFNRYYTFDVVRAVCEAGKENIITLYTGNDDNIVIDLLTEYKIHTAKGYKKVRIKGGLLGHWAVWTKKAVELLTEVHDVINSGSSIPQSLLTKAIEITDTNAVFFDVANDFKGCIPGIHAILKRQGLLRGIWCLNPKENLSTGQLEEIDRVYKAYPHLNDDDFVKANLNTWLS